MTAFTHLFGFGLLLPQLPQMVTGAAVWILVWFGGDCVCWGAVHRRAQGVWCASARRSSSCSDWGPRLVPLGRILDDLVALTVARLAAGLCRRLVLTPGDHRRPPSRKAGGDWVPLVPPWGLAWWDRPGCRSCGLWLLRRLFPAAARSQSRDRGVGLGVDARSASGVQAPGLRHLGRYLAARSSAGS